MKGLRQCIDQILESLKNITFNIIITLHESTLEQLNIFEPVFLNISVCLDAGGARDSGKDFNNSKKDGKIDI